MHDIPPKVDFEIKKICRNMSVDKMILFGSRARGDNGDRSDIDLAFRAKNTAEFFLLKDALEEIDTLLSFDLVDLNSDNISRDLIDEIESDGVVLYEKV